MLTTRASAAFWPASKFGEERSCDRDRRRWRRGHFVRCAAVGFVVLVADVADELLEQILERDEADRPAGVIAHDRQMQPLAKHAEE